MLSFANATGNLFNRLGKLGLCVKTIKIAQTTLLPNMTDPTNGVVGQYNAESDLQALMGSNYIGVLSGLEGVCQTTRNMATQTINRMVFRDNPQYFQTLTQVNKLISIAYVINQMRGQGASVLRMTVGATPGAFNGTGNGVVVVSTVRPFDGLPLENSYAENVLVTCTADSYSGGATAGNEPFTITGAGAQTDPFAFNWPLGSNGNTSVNAISGAGNNSLGSILQNGGFDTYANVPNVPDNWTLFQGTAGVNTFQETTLVYAGAGALKLVGGGVNVPVTLRQQFNSSSGTSATLTPQTQYSFNMFLRRDGTQAGTGQLTASLVDGGGNVINDQAGTPNTFTINLTGLTTNYAAYNGVFRTPHILPATVYLQLSTPTGQGLTNGRAVYLDYSSLGLMSQLYTSGPFFSVHSGNVPFIASPVADNAQVAITNSRGVGGTLSTFQTLWAQLFPEMISQEFLLPSSASPTISDGLIG